MSIIYTSPRPGRLRDVIPLEPASFVSQTLRDDNVMRYEWFREHDIGPEPHTGEVYLRTPYIRVCNGENCWEPDEELGIIWLKGVIIHGGDRERQSVSIWDIENNAWVSSGVAGPSLPTSPEEFLDPAKLDRLQSVFESINDPHLKQTYLIKR